MPQFDPVDSQLSEAMKLALHQHLQSTVPGTSGDESTIKLARHVEYLKSLKVSISQLEKLKDALGTNPSLETFQQFGAKFGLKPHVIETLFVLLRRKQVCAWRPPAPTPPRAPVAPPSVDPKPHSTKFYCQQCDSCFLDKRKLVAHQFALHDGSSSVSSSSLKFKTPEVVQNVPEPIHKVSEPNYSGYPMNYHQPLPLAYQAAAAQAAYQHQSYANAQPSWYPHPHYSAYQQYYHHQPIYPPQPHPLISNNNQVTPFGYCLPVYPIGNSYQQQPRAPYPLSIPIVAAINLNHRDAHAQTDAATANQNSTATPNQLLQNSNVAATEPTGSGYSVPGFSGHGSFVSGSTGSGFSGYGSSGPGPISIPLSSFQQGVPKVVPEKSDNLLMSLLLNENFPENSSCVTSSVDEPQPSQEFIRNPESFRNSEPIANPESTSKLLETFFKKPKNSSESPQARAKRLERQKRAKRRLIENETPEQRKLRLAKQKIANARYYSKIRSNEDAHTKTRQRLKQNYDRRKVANPEYNRLYWRKKIASETEQQRKDRLRKQREYRAEYRLKARLERLILV